MLREQLHAVVELEREVLEEEARVRRVEREDNRLVVRCLNRLDVLLHVPAVGQLLVVLEQVEGEGHVIRGEGLTVTPLGTLADVDGERAEVLGIRVAGGKPRDHVVSEGGIIEERLPEGSVANLMGCAGCVRVANAGVGELSATATKHHAQGATTGKFRRLRASFTCVEEAKSARNRGRTRSTSETQHPFTSLLKFHRSYGPPAQGNPA